MLYFNNQTKVIFGSDQAQDLAVCRVITEEEVPDLIANGATVDESANYAAPVVTPKVVDSQNVGTEVPNDQSTSTDSSSAGTPSESTENADAPDAPAQDAPAISSGTEGEYETKTYGDGAVATGIAPLPDLSPGQQDTLSSGTTVEVSQVGDSTVNTGIQQNGNMLAGQATGNQLVNSGVTVDAPAVVVKNTERDLNPLVPAAGTEGPPASQLAAQAELPAEEEMPRESHLMLLESKFGAILAKLRNQERVAADEVEALYAHVKAVL